MKKRAKEEERERERERERRKKGDCGIRTSGKSLAGEVTRCRCFKSDKIFKKLAILQNYLLGYMSDILSSESVTTLTQWWRKTYCASVCTIRLRLRRRAAT